MIQVLGKSSIVFLAFAGLAAADMYTGILIDAACPAEQKSAPRCDPTPSTRSFAVILPGDQLKTLRLDGTGNAKAAAALKNGGRKPNDQNAAGRRSLIVTVTGAIRGGEIAVESLQID